MFCKLITFIDKLLKTTNKSLVKVVILYVSLIFFSCKTLYPFYELFCSFVDQGIDQTKTRKKLRKYLLGNCKPQYRKTMIQW